MKKVLVIIAVFVLIDIYVGGSNYSHIDLPRGHLSMYFNNYQEEQANCQEDPECIYKDFLLSSKYRKKACWGYETWCEESHKFSRPACNESASPRGANRVGIFYNQADFGYIKEQIEQLSIMCEPTFQTDSSLECSKYLRFCRGRNLMINFTDLVHRSEPIRYNTDVLKDGDIGGHCKLHKERLLNETEHYGALQSWAPELKVFRQLSSPVNGACDIVINKPTFVMKIDATSNMYHHFCDFFNLYASLHVNSTNRLAFDKDVQIIIWESYTYESPFAEVFKAFSSNEIWDLKAVRGHAVCFKNIVFPLLPRMIFGLYYNTPIIHGCSRSGLFRAFSEHILHRLRIPLLSRKEKKVRITFLVRRTKYRRALNEDDLLNEIVGDNRYFVRKISFDRGVTFKDQLKIIRNTDVLIGMHGAGLTHLLFLPNWATLFELYNCEDPNCYKDLARLRGINYITWEDNKKIIVQNDEQHSKNGAHAKFTNYIFDKKEFSRLVSKAATFVLKNEEFYKFFESQDFPPHDEFPLELSESSESGKFWNEIQM